MIVTDVPPAAGPEDGLIEMIVGGGGGPPIAYAPELTDGRSEVVLTETVSVVDTVEGLVTPSNSMLTAWPAGIDWPPMRPQVATSPFLVQLPTCVRS